jgi:hypothetical protein
MYKQITSTVFKKKTTAYNSIIVGFSFNKREHEALFPFNS